MFGLQNTLAGYFPVDWRCVTLINQTHIKLFLSQLPFTVSAKYNPKYNPMLARALLRFGVSKSVPIVDVEPYLSNKNSTAQCETVMKALKDFGCLIIKDPRVKPQDNEQFLDMMERFFDSRSKEYYQGKMRDIFPETAYQVGATPEFKQLAKSHEDVKKKYTGGNGVATKLQPDYDAKWRYFWRMGELTEEQKTKNVRHEPDGFPQWKRTMDSWGNHMLNGCFTVAQMFAMGAGIPKNTFTKLMQRGPHLLAPTGSDLERYKQDTVFAGFHYDFNFLTIHGKSRFPGLFAWLRTGEKISVSVPEGHLLLQAGKEFEILTGGYVTCGFHQVIYTEQTKAAKEKAIKQGKIPWRVSSTLFSHIRGDVMLEPVEKFKSEKGADQYKPILAKDFAEKQLKDIKLAA